MPVGVHAIRFSYGESAWLQIQSNDTCCICHIVSNHIPGGILYSKVPAGHAAAIGRSLDDLRLTSPLIAEGNCCGLVCLNRQCLCRLRIVDPVLVDTVRFRHLIISGQEIQYDFSGCVRYIVTDLITRRILYCKMPTCLTAAVGSFLHDFTSAGNQFIYSIDRNCHIWRILGQCNCPLRLSTRLIATGKNRFHNRESREGKLPGDGISAAVSGANDIVGTGCIVGCGEIGTG